MLDAVQPVKHVHHSVSVLHVKIPISLLEVEFVLIAPIHAQLVTVQELVLLA